jgi:hypothetical protein
MLPAGIVFLSMVNSQNLSKTGFSRLSFYDDYMPPFLIRLFPDFELWLEGTWRHCPYLAPLCATARTWRQCPYLAPLTVSGAIARTWRHCPYHPPRFHPALGLFEIQIQIQIQIVYCHNRRIYYN